MKEGGCPFTKMCKLAGTPHVGAILIVLFVIAGGAYYFLMSGLVPSDSQEGVVDRLLELNEKEEIENGLKKFKLAPRGYIKITNGPNSVGVDLEAPPLKEDDGYNWYRGLARDKTKRTQEAAIRDAASIRKYPQEVQFTGTAEDPEIREIGPQNADKAGGSAFVDPEYEKFVRNANKGAVDVPKSEIPAYSSLNGPPSKGWPVVIEETVPTLTDQAVIK